MTISNQEKVTTNDGLAEAYKCVDGTWRVAAFPYDDKDRNLTYEQAMNLLPIRHKQALDIVQAGEE